MNDISNSTNSQTNGIPVDYDPFADGEILFTLPSTEAQREIWLAVQVDEEATLAYNESAVLRMKGPLNVEALKAAFSDLIQRHEALRITFTPDGESICINASLNFEIPQIDISSLSKTEQEDRIVLMRRQTLDQAFDITHGPLLRAQLVKINGQEYELIIVIHHLISDAWSWSVLLDDLGALYTARVQGVAPDLPEPDNFSDYVSDMMDSEDAKEAEEYWLEKFSDEIHPLDIPTDRPRSAYRSFRSSRQDLSLNPELIGQLKQIGANAKCSFMTTLLATFEIFWHRLTSQEDVIIGILAAGQANVGKFDLVGHCVNMLPIRSKINADLTFEAYLKARRGDILDDFDHQQFTFGSLLQKLDVPRDPSRVPILPVLLNIDQSIKAEENQFHGLDVAIDEIPRHYDNFEFFINALEKAENLVILECQYNTDLFDAETIRHRLDEFETLLEGIVKNPQVKISTLPIVPQEERQKLLVDWNATAVNYPDDKCIHELFELQVGQSADKVAAVFEKQQVTYQDLNGRANRLANHLISLGVTPGVVVGLFLERSLDMVVALLGVLKAGGTYLPLDISYPSERIAYMIEDAGASVLIAQDALISSLPTLEAQIVRIDTDWPTINGLSEENLGKHAKADGLAHIIYTSGSTGKPKGVQIGHSSVVNLLLSMTREPGFTAEDSILAITTLSFDIAGLEIFLPLVTGAQVEMVSAEIASDGLLLAKKLKESSATVVQATPSRWQMLVEAGWQGHDKLRIISGGESLPPKLAEQLLQRCDQLWNQYGPSETTIYSSVHRVLPGEAPIPIGHPIANTQIHILDASENLIPIGIPGELHIGGVGLSNGYLNRQQLTKDKFISNPFSNNPADRLYKTGDIARYRLDGEIEFLGRSDHQVKVRGYRIELGEIEARLQDHPDVKQAVVSTYVYELEEQVHYHENRLVAYLIQQSGTKIDPGDLRQYMSLSLPEYMIPDTFIELDDFPITSSGKVDRKALPQPDKARPDLVKSFVAPRTPVEEKLSLIWAEVLNLEKIGVSDDFFVLGGHSLLATRVTTRLSSAFDLVLPLKLFFQNPTIEQQGQLIEAHQYQQETEIAPHGTQDSDTIVI